MIITKNIGVITKQIWKHATDNRCYMNALVKISSVNNEDLSGLRKIFDDVRSHVRSLVNLGVKTRTHGSLLCLIILGKLPNELRLIVSRNNNENNLKS